MIDLGTVRPGRTIRIPFSSFDKDDGSSITMTNYAAADILIYKDGNTTARASTAGFTATTDFSSKTGKHLAIIDLADNTTADFFNAGSEYLVAIDAVTVDGVTTGGWIARFLIGYTDAMFNTTIATRASQTSFTLTVGPAEDDALNGCSVILHDIASAVQSSWAVVQDYTGSTKTVTLATTPTFTTAAGDNISVMFPAPLQATTEKLSAAGATLDVSSTGEAGVDWANVGSKTTTNALTGTTIATTQKVDVETIKTNAVVNGGTVTFPTSATLASTTNITSATGINVTQFGGSNGTFSSGRPEVNTSHIGGTVQTTGQDIVANITTLLGRITSTLFSGITQLSHWLGMLAGKQTPNSTAQTEIRATGAGSGTYDATTDSLEGFKDATATAAQVAAAVTATIQLKKNTALASYPFTMYLAGTRTPATGKTITATKLLDADSAFSSMSSSATEVGSTGTYRISLAAADINGNAGTWKFTASGCDPLIIHFVTQS